MWHEARKQEKKLRVMIVDYRKRAERRREFYEKFKADPTQFMQVHGRPSKIYLEPQIAASAENCMMPWQGNTDNMIDRFDVRAHLDIIPEWHSASSSTRNVAVEEEEANPGIHYERYRILIQNDLSGVSEDKFLHQIHLEEQFGTSATPHSHLLTKGQQPKATKAAIGYTYEDSTPAFSTQPPPKAATSVLAGAEADEESEEEIDFDLLVNVDDLTHGQKGELNNFGTKYGLGVGDFMKFLNADLEEKEKMRLAKLQEEEKQAMSGRKARRERRAYKDKLIMRKGHVSPPSYATYAASQEEETTISRRSSSRSESRSRSNSPEKITFITSFGGNESDEGGKDTVNKPLPFEPRSGFGLNSSISKKPLVFGPSLPSAFGEKKSADLDRLSSKRRRSSRSSSRDGRRRSSSNRRRHRTRSRSRSPRRRSRRKDSRSRSRSRDRRRRRSSSSSRSRSRSRTSRRRRYRRKSSSSFSRSRSRSRGRSNRRRRRSSRSSSSVSRSRSRRRRSTRSSSRSRRRSSRSKSRKKRRRSRSHSRRRASRKRSRSSSSTSVSSPAKLSHRRRRSSKSSSSSSTSRKSKSREPSKSTSKSPVKESEKVETVTQPIAASSNDIVNASEVPRKSPSPLPPPPVRRYYGRRQDKSSSSDTSEMSLSDSDTNDGSGDSWQNGNKKNHKRDPEGSQLAKGKSGSASKDDSSGTSHGHLGSSSVAKLTPKERLRRKMQVALSKTFKADKEAEKQRLEKMNQERMEREESLRELTIKYRRREREKRHRDRGAGGWSSSSSRSSRSRSRSRSSSRRSRSRSKSPYQY